MKKTLLLGAGFSFDFGMPLAAEVTAVFLGLFNDRNARRLAEILSTREPYTKDRPINRAAIHQGIDLLLRFKEENGTNYESFLAELERLPTKTQSDRDSHHFLFSVFYDLLYRILVTYQIESYGTLYLVNHRWFSKLSSALSVEETWIFTLNHDLYLECLAIDFGIPITYGDTEEFVFPVSNVNMDDKIRLTCSKRENLLKDGPGWIVGKTGINLVRLHGGFSELEYKDRSLICNPALRADPKTS